MESRTEGSSIGIPGAIIIAAAIIGGAVLWSQRPAPTDDRAAARTSDLPATGASAMAPVTSSDHILGNPNAPVMLVEYSDPSCPYCKLFNPTLERIIEEYGPGGKVAWVYRHFPLHQPDSSGNILHPNAGRQSQALECSAALGGNTTFWAYEKKWYEVFPNEGANRTPTEDNAQLASVAESVGLDPVSFNDCLASGRFKDKIEQSVTEGINAGVSGTPYLVIVTPSGSKIPLVGSQSYQTLKTTIDALIEG